MGCCQSNTNQEDDAPPPSQLRGANQSDAALTSSHSASNPDSNHSTASNGPSAHIKSARKPNKPIRAPSPLGNSPANVTRGTGPWTRAQLLNERNAFFDTRVTGRAEIWTTLRVVCELLQQGNVADAQGILDAVGMTCPTGRVATGRGRERNKGGVYDERGELYELPHWVVTDPLDIIDDAEEHSREGAHDEKELDDDDLRSSSEQPERMQKGKGRATDLGEQVSLRLRLSDRGTDVLVTAGLKEPVLSIVKKVRNQIGMKRVRLMCLGHVLHENRCLSAQGYQVGNVINAFVFEGSEDMLKKDATN